MYGEAAEFLLDCHTNLVGNNVFTILLAAFYTQSNPHNSFFSFLEKLTQMFDNTEILCLPRR